MEYLSTRKKTLRVSSAKAIEQGLSVEGGLFVPAAFPSFSKEEMSDLLPLSYAQRAAFVMGKFLTDYTKDEIEACVKAAYRPESFVNAQYANSVPLSDKLRVLELWHGPTHAFKDMALQILPHLLVRAMQKNGQKHEVMILVATSGDTGKAALEGFKDVDNTQVMVFYPYGGVSYAQQMQMATQRGGNVHVCAVRGNFDDAQTGVKKIFADPAIKEELLSRNIVLSSANSINFGRLLPQVVYYVSAYCDAVRDGLPFGEKLNVVVPTGNFGDILAAYYAKKCGLPLGKLICASNKNHILADLMESGKYDLNDRPFHKTTSPSMDILISSNWERLLFELVDRDDEKVVSLMEDLKTKGVYQLSRETHARLLADFAGGWVEEETVKQAISCAWKEKKYLMDPHTAVGYAVYEAYRKKTGDETPTLLVSTASPYKFARDVLLSIGLSDEGLDDFACAYKLQEVTALPMPETLRELQSLPILHDQVCEISEMPFKVLSQVG